MNCLCCGKPLKESIRSQQTASGWHESCIKRFFGTKELPALDISPNMLEQLARDSINRGFTVPGVQKKLSLCLSSNTTDRKHLTMVGYPSGYILKPQTEDYDFLPAFEYLVMQMAKETGIKTVPFALIKTSDASSLAYITKRIDRTIVSGEMPQKYAMEDFCQLDQRLTADKYKGSYERCTKIIQSYSVSPRLDITEIYLRIVFSFAIGNSDMHLKNFSLIETAPGSGLYHLSEAYDMLPVNLVLPADKDQMALTLNGKNRNLHRNDFLILADNCGLDRKVAEKLIQVVINKRDTYLEMCKTYAYIPEDRKEALCTFITSRITTLSI